MIERLVIRGLGVIDEAAIDFHPGLTAITGETGAGKTMVLTGLGLIAGGKADAALIRSDCGQASVEAEWVIDVHSAAVERLLDAGAELEGDADARVILARTVSEGRSRAFAGGRGVPAGVLQEVSEHLIAVHGQAEQQRLRSPSVQRDLLDRFAGPPATQARAAYRALHADWRAATSELRTLREERESRERESALLALGIAEIEGVAPTAGEDVELDRQAAMLGHAGALRHDVGAAHDALVGGDDDAGSDALSVIAGARQALERAAAVDPALEPLAMRLRELAALIPDLAGDLAGYAATVDADPLRQAQVEERRAQLAAIARRHGGSVDAALAWLEHARATVEEVAGDEERLAELARREARLAQETMAAAARLGEVRRTAARALAGAVTEELAALAMPDARLEIEVASAERIEDFDASGADEVELRLVPHGGAQARAVTRGASGGELSRVMLAIEVALAGSDPVPTFVFDEVDAGIGGRAAIEVGRRLARLARTAQVIVVTHLPQVAAFADRHVVVTKASGAVTSSGVRMVDGPERLDELVRMLSGLEATEAGTAHAEELLAVAEAERAGAPRAGRPTRARR